MPINLAKYLTPLGVSADEIAEIYGSITDARSETDDIRAGVIYGALLFIILLYPSPALEIRFGILTDC